MNGPSPASGDAARESADRVLATYRTGADVAGLLAGLCTLGLLVWSSVALREAHLEFQRGETVPVLWHVVGHVLLLVVGAVAATWLHVAHRQVPSRGVRRIRNVLVLTMAGTTLFSLGIHALGATRCFITCGPWL